MPHQTWPMLFPFPPTFFFCTLQTTAIHCAENSISVFLLHFKVAENNTLNGKMKYVPSAACYLSAPTAPSLPSSLPAYMHTSFNSNRKTKWREKGKTAWLACFPCVSSKINHGSFSLHQDRYHLRIPQHPFWGSDNILPRFALNWHYSETELRRAELSTHMQNRLPLDMWQPED